MSILCKIAIEENVKIKILYMNKLNALIMILLLVWGFFAQDILSLLDGIALSIISYISMTANHTIEVYQNLLISANATLYILFIGIISISYYRIKSKTIDLKLLTKIFNITLIIFLSMRIISTILFMTVPEIGYTYMPDGEQDDAQIERFYAIMGPLKNLVYAVSLIIIGLIVVKKIQKTSNAT
mgnify:CR=1 FL=1